MKCAARYAPALVNRANQAANSCQGFEEQASRYIPCRSGTASFEVSFRPMRYASFTVSYPNT